MKTKLHCKFKPQAWINDYAYPVDPEGETEWDMVFEGEELPEEYSYESDDLRNDPACPKWCQEWEGPFEVEYEIVENID